MPIASYLFHKLKEFLALYSAYAADTSPPEVPDHLIGISEANNRDHFPEFVPKPVQIGGEPEKKQKRIEG